MLWINCPKEHISLLWPITIPLKTSLKYSTKKSINITDYHERSSPTEIQDLQRSSGKNLRRFWNPNEPFDSLPSSNGWTVWKNLPYFTRNAKTLWKLYAERLEYVFTWSGILIQQSCEWFHQVFPILLGIRTDPLSMIADMLHCEESSKYEKTDKFTEGINQATKFAQS